MRPEPTPPVFWVASIISPSWAVLIPIPYRLAAAAAVVELDVAVVKPEVAVLEVVLVNRPDIP